MPKPPIIHGVTDGPIYETGRFFAFLFDILKSMFTGATRWSLIRDQFFNIGLLSMPVVAITGFSTGLVLAAQSFFQLADKGLSGATGLMVAKAMTTELGPILTAFMVTGRMGSAMCAELGTMKVTEQIDALRTMSINPNRYLIIPRVIAGTVMLPFLTIFCVLLGILGGYLISIYIFHMPPANYFLPMASELNEFDYLTSIVKAIFFGFAFSTISCYQGIHTHGGAAGVGRATTHSVVICYSLILLMNFAITFGMNVLNSLGLLWL